VPEHGLSSAYRLEDGLAVGFGVGAGVAVLVGCGVAVAADCTVAVAAGWDSDDGGEFLDNYLRVTRRAKAVVRKVFGG